MLLSLVSSDIFLLILQFSKVHGLVACGGEDGATECFDMRAKSSVGRINVAASVGDNDQVTHWFS